MANQALNKKHLTSAGNGVYVLPTSGNYWVNSTVSYDFSKKQKLFTLLDKLSVRSVKKQMWITISGVGGGGGGAGGSGYVVMNQVSGNMMMITDK